MHPIAMTEGSSRRGLRALCAALLAPLCALAPACGGDPAPANDAPPRAPDEVCTPDQAHAPASREVDGLVATPIDITDLDAKVTIDAAARVATAEATVKFVMGGREGHPIFDLRQPITEAWMNGEPLDPARLAHHDLGGGQGAQMRVIASKLAACSENTLTLRYPLETPDAAHANPIDFDPSAARVHWDFWLSDLSPGRYLEMWFPANLIHDRFAMTLDMELVGVDSPHTLITNGDVEALDADHFRVTYPDTFTALSPMLLLMPEDQVKTHVTTIEDLGSGPLTVELTAPADTALDMVEMSDAIASHVGTFTASTGLYAHGDRLQVYLEANLSRSMEYDGATTTSPEGLKHELFHMWYGRGAKPLSAGAGWIDEAWTMYNTDAGIAFTTKSFTLDSPKRTLDSGNPWSRSSSGSSYVQGASLFAMLASALGMEPLREQMKLFYEAHRVTGYTTDDLEKHLYCATLAPEVRAAFHRYVHGHDAPPEPLPAGYCDP